jgi:hypothetical protein
MRRAARRFSAVCLLAVTGPFGFVNDVSAQPAPPAQPSTSSSSSAGVAPPAGKRAEDLAAIAYDQQAAGQYADAIGSYLEAYKLSGAAIILFNVAVIYDHKLHEESLASDYYRRYLGLADADPELARKATSSLEALNRARKLREASSQTAPASSAAPPAASAPEATAPLPPAAAPPTSEGGSWQRTTGFVVGGVGLLALGATAVLSVVAKVQDGDANAYCNGNACTDQRGVDLAKSSGDFSTAATVTFIGGAALLAAGVVLYLLSPSNHSVSARSALEDAARFVRTTGRGTPSIGGAF